MSSWGDLPRTRPGTPGFLSAEDLLEQGWDENADPFTSTVTVIVGRLRRKLGSPAVITTTPGVGSRIAEAPTAERRR